MRRLIALVVLVTALPAPFALASPPSVLGEWDECYFLEVTIPPYKPSTRVCFPVHTE